MDTSPLLTDSEPKAETATAETPGVDAPREVPKPKPRTKAKPARPAPCPFCELIGKGVRPAGLYHEDQDCWIFPTDDGGVTGVWKRHGETGALQRNLLVARTDDTARARHPDWETSDVEVSKNHHLVVEVKRGGRAPAATVA